MIRAAKPSDADVVVPLIIQAMGKLAGKFANSNDPDVIIALFKHFFIQDNNQYSFQNTLVYTEKNHVLGSLNAYDGAKLFILRKNFTNYLAKNRGLTDFHPEAETQPGEFYLDTISVNHNMQGKGIGKLLIHAGIDWARNLGHQKVGLLVEKNNTKAFKLYQKMGFTIQNEHIFIGEDYLHMVCQIDNSNS